MKKMYIYKASFRPYLRGGNVHAAARCQINVPKKLHKLGKTVGVYLINMRPGFVGAFCHQSGGMCGVGSTEAIALAYVQKHVDKVTVEHVKTAIRAVKEKLKDPWHYYTVTWDEFVKERKLYGRDATRKNTSTKCRNVGTRCGSEGHGSRESRSHKPGRESGI